tara:strand:+ start:139 stop:1905 length:1767 start_codon:yes stop_codon:yes gene_type:complete
MGCDKDKIFSIEDRLAEIQARKEEIQRIKMASAQPIKVPEGEIGISNAKGTNRLYRGSDGKVRRYITMEGKEITPQYKNLNTIDGKPDELDEDRISDPRLRKGNKVSVVLQENDYWKNNKWSIDEEWKEAPLYIVNEEGDPIEMIEAYKEHKKGTLARKEIYEALQEGKKVDLTIKDKKYNFNNMQFAGSPIFLDVNENLTPALLKNSEGDIIESPVDQQPILVAARGIETDHWGQAGVPEWHLGAMPAIEDESIQRAIRNDVGLITPIYEGVDKNTAAGQIAAVVLAPDNKYTIAYLSTRTLSDKAVDFVLNSLSQHNTKEALKIVPNNTRLENAFKNEKFLNMQSLVYKEQNRTFINFYSKEHAAKGKGQSIVRVEAEELAKALNGEKFTYNTGVFGIRSSERKAAEEEIAKGGSPKAPNPVYMAKKKIVSLPTEGVNVLGELSAILKAKKHQVDADLLNSDEAFEIPGFTKAGGYNTYQEYLFDPQAHGENFNLATDIVNNTAIINTDIKRINNSIFFNSTLTFSDMEIDGKSTLAVEEGKVITDISVGTSERVVTPGPRIRRKQARTIEEQIAAEKEKLDNCGF